MLADLVDHDDVFVAELGGRAGFEDKASRDFRIFTLHELDRDAASEFEITGQEHRSHAAAPQLADDFILADTAAGGGDADGYWQRASEATGGWVGSVAASGVIVLL
ncbi:MAG: hypothetical protein Tsb0020_06120 [Haliangiales bacterium]